MKFSKNEILQISNLLIKILKNDMHQQTLNDDFHEFINEMKEHIKDIKKISINITDEVVHEEPVVIKKGRGRPRLHPVKEPILEGY
jgi:hypothetical protein